MSQLFSNENQLHASRKPISDGTGSAALFARSLGCNNRHESPFHRHLRLCGKDTQHANTHSLRCRVSGVFVARAQMSAKSFRLVRQLLGDQQEAVGEYKHTCNAAAAWAKAVINGTLRGKNANRTQEAFASFQHCNKQDS